MPPDLVDRGSLSEDIADACVRVVSGAESYGTAFAVSHDVMLTCAHVVEGVSPTEIELHLPSGETLGVVELEVPASSDDDIAVLRTAPHGLRQLRLGTTQAEGSEVLAFGYQNFDRGYSGFPILTRLGGVAFVRGPGRQSLLVLATGAVRGGQSGGPVIELGSGEVVGIVKRSNPDGGGYAVPIGAVAAHFSWLADRNRHDVPPLHGALGQLGRYRALNAAEHGEIRLLEGARWLPLAEIFVSIAVAPREIVDSRRSERPSTRFGLDASTGVRDQGSRLARYDRVRVSLAEVTSMSGAMLVGDPGTGKTTLLKHLMQRVLAGDVYPGRTPVLLRLEDVAARPGFVGHYVQDAYSSCGPAVVRELDAGRAVVLLDGLDEVDETGQRSALNEANRLIAAGNAVLITCRTASYRPHLLPAGFRTFECLGFDPPERREFISRWFAESPAKAHQVSAEIERQNRLRDLARNPLLLSLMALLADEGGGQLPRSRSDLYERSIEHLIGRRPTRGGPVPPPRLRRRCAEALALELQRRRIESVARDEAAEWVEASMSADERTVCSADVVLEWLETHDGLLVPQSRQALRFLHLTLQEYLAAELLHLSGEWLGEVRRNAGDPRWEETLVLLAGRLESEADTVKLIDALGDPSQTQAFDHEEDRLILAGRCAAESELVPSSLLASLVDGLIPVASGRSAPWLTGEATEILGHLVRAGGVEFERRLLSSRDPETSLPAERVIEVLGVAGSPSATRTLLDALATWHNRGVYDEDVLLLISAVMRSLVRQRHPECGRLLASLTETGERYLGMLTAECLVELRDYDTSLRIAEIEVPSEIAPFVGFALGVSTTSGSGTWGYLLDDAGPVEFRRGVAQGMRFGRLAFQERVLATWIEAGGQLEVTGANGVDPLLAASSQVDACEEVLRSGSRDSAERCRAAEVLARFAPSRLMTLSWDQLAPETVQVIVDVLRVRRNSELAGKVGELLETADAEGVWCSALRYFQTVPAPPSALKAIVGHAEGAVTWSRTAADGLMAAAFNGLGVAAERSRSILLGREGNADASAEARFVALSALQRLGNDEAETIAIMAMEHESDIALIEHGVRACRAFNGEASADLLVRCLSPEAWPRSWPARRPPLRQGEQRARDGRVLEAIEAVQFRVVTAALAPLQGLLEDDAEDSFTRQRAAGASRELRALA